MKYITLISFVFISFMCIAQSGSIDLTFGDGGVKIIDCIGPKGRYNYTSSIANDGEKFIIAGKTGNKEDASDPTLVRLNEDGDLDSSFSDDGVLFELVSGAYIRNFDDLYVYSDGKILVCGSRNEKVQVIRYNIDGTRDSSFAGGDGLAQLINEGADFGESSAMFVQADGKIVIVATWNYAHKLFLARLNSDGSIDNTFGSEGSVNYYGYDYGEFCEIDSKLEVTSTGRIFIPCIFNLDDDANGSISAWAFTSTGAIDSSIGVNGFLMYPNPDEDFIDLEASAVDADDNLFECGLVYDGLDSRLIIIKYNSDGVLDSTFGVEGVSKLNHYDTLLVSYYVESLNFQPDGKLLLGGRDFSSTIAPYIHLNVNRLLTDGSIDSTFGTNGITKFPFPTGLGLLSKTICITPSGKIMYTGNSSDFSHYDFATVRWNTDDECSIPLPLEPDIISDNSVKLNWMPFTIYEKYKLQYRVLGTSTWTNKTVDGAQSSKILNDLPCSKTYQWRIKSICLDGTSGDFSSIQTFTTLACREGFEELTEVNISTNGNQIYVEFHENQQNKLIEIFNLSGQKLYSQTGDAGSNVIDFKFPSGLYVVSAGEHRATIAITR